MLGVTKEAAAESLPGNFEPRCRSLDPFICDPFFWLFPFQAENLVTKQLFPRLFVGLTWAKPVQSDLEGKSAISEFSESPDKRPFRSATFLEAFPRQYRFSS